MINLFPPGGVANPDLATRDPMKFDETQELHERQLREYSCDGEAADSSELLFIAFAEAYYSNQHLDDVALFYDFLEWADMKDIIRSGGYPVPNVTTPSGITAARKMLKDLDLL